MVCEAVVQPTPEESCGMVLKGHWVVMGDQVVPTGGILQIGCPLVHAT